MVIKMGCSATCHCPAVYCFAGQTHTLYTASAAAEAAAAIATQPPTSQPQQPASVEGQQPSSSQNTAKQQQQQAAVKQRPNKVNFEKLQEQYQEQLEQHNVRGGFTEVPGCYLHMITISDPVWAVYLCTQQSVACFLVMPHNCLTWYT